MTNAIAVHGLGKQFRRYHMDRPKTLKDAFIKGLHRMKPADRFWALRDVSFSVPRGRMVGIIGGNGSGKSTLLRVVGGVVRPNEGRAEVQGRLGALIDLGAGFHGDLTGRENIFVNGVIGGLTRAEVASRFESIVDFAELEEFIDSPLSTYSTGMQMRLGFAVAIHTDPEVLLIDEVLSVGDLSFQHKCLERINQFKTEGTSIILASHDMKTVQELCDQVLWLHKGRLVAFGDPDLVIGKYVAYMSGDRSLAADSPHDLEQSRPEERVGFL